MNVQIKTPNNTIGLILTLMLFLLIAFNSSATTSLAPEQKFDKQEIVDAYVYLLGRALVVRQEKIDFQDSELKYNTIKYNEVGKADFVNPNLDVAYMESWIAIDTESAVIIDIPEIKHRYYTVQLIDGWGEVIVNINERNFPKHPFGKFALVMKGSGVDIPDDAVKIELSYPKVKMLARVELQDTIDEAIDLQKKFKISLLGTPEIPQRSSLPLFTNKDLVDSIIFHYSKQFLNVPDSDNIEINKVRSSIRKIKKALTEETLTSEEIDHVIRTEAIPKFINYAVKKAGNFEEGWLAALHAGNYYGNYWTRSAANFVGIWANTTSEVVYFIASNDSNNEKLGSGNSYKLVIAPDKLPSKEVKSFWSVILVSFPQYRVVPNYLNRYNFNNYSQFEYEPDGSLVLYIAPSYVDTWPKSNWLPSPKTENFNLTLRMYVPKENVKEGLWFPPALEKL